MDALHTVTWLDCRFGRKSDYGKAGVSEPPELEERCPGNWVSFLEEKGLLLKRAFMSICAAAIVLSFAVSVAAAPAPASKRDPKPGTASSKKAAPKLSKWQQHVLEVLRDAAPGDEYFGRMKMSYLGINNTFHDDAIRAGAYTTDPHLISSLTYADEALNAWAKKYPNDPQLARSYFLAFEMYRKVWTQEYQQKAWQYAHIVIQKWPSSFFGKTLQKSLSVGFTEHYFATPVACQTLMPSPSGSPSPSPSVSPSPSPSPTPTAAPGQPKVDVLPVPCIAPTPIPTESGAPTPSPTPTKH